MDNQNINSGNLNSQSFTEPAKGPSDGQLKSELLSTPAPATSSTPTGDHKSLIAIIIGIVGIVFGAVGMIAGISAGSQLDSVKGSVNLLEAYLDVDEEELTEYVNSDEYLYGEDDEEDESYIEDDEEDEDNTDNAETDEDNA